MFGIDWSLRMDDTALTQFAQLGFWVFDEVFCIQDFQALQNESGWIAYQQAALTNGEQISQIRGDKTRWIDTQCPIGLQYLHSIENLGVFLNRQYYLGIRRAEAHYAFYKQGMGYLWHKDNRKNERHRIISAVFYLNEDWQEQDGGHLMLIDKQEQQHSIIPKANRLIIFDSDLLHQVAITQKPRYSIATWLRGDVL